MSGSLMNIYLNTENDRDEDTQSTNRSHFVKNDTGFDFAMHVSINR